MPSQAQLAGIARACAECHKRKIRCDVQENGHSCSNCKLYGTACQLRARKRRNPNPASRSDHSGPAGDRSEIISRRRLKNGSDLRRRTSSPDRSPTRSPVTARVDEPVLTAEDTHSSNDIVPNGEAHLDYSDYYGHHTYLKKSSDRKPTSADSKLSESDMQVLRLHNAFDLPAEPLRTSLVDNFMKYCFPWVPIFDRRWLWDGESKGSPALSQAVLVAGARTSNIALSCQEYFSAAKYLLLCGHETNPVLTIVACLLLGWWNQSSPDIVSLDNSNSWIRQAIGVAYQIDLHKESRTEAAAAYRRRLWWTLVARDSQLSASHGRPRYINLAICHIRPLSLDDLPDESSDSMVFMAYVKASIILGDLAESCQQGSMSPARFAELRNALFWWLKELPPSLECFRPGVLPSEHNFNMRQVYTLYLSAVAILHRSNRKTRGPSIAELIASSFIIGLFQDFHSRNELCRLSAGFNFYPIVAAIPQLEALNSYNLGDGVQEDIQVIEDSLRDLGNRWPSARRGLKLLEKVRQSFSTAKATKKILPALRPNDSDLLLFDNFDYSKCRIWSTLKEVQIDKNTVIEPARAPQEATQEAQDIPYMKVPSSAVDVANTSAPNMNLDPPMALGYDDIAYWLPNATFDQRSFWWLAS